MTYFRRRTLTWWEELGAAALGAAVGLGAYYVIRNLVRRQDLPRDGSRAGTGAGDAVGGGSRGEGALSGGGEGRGASRRSAGGPGGPGATEDAGRPEGRRPPGGGADGPR